MNSWEENSWTDNYYHTDKGKILGSISLYDNRYKALLDNVFIGWYISEDHAKAAIEESYRDSLGLTIPRMS